MSFLVLCYVLNLLWHWQFKKTRLDYSANLLSTSIRDVLTTISDKCMLTTDYDTRYTRYLNGLIMVIVINITQCTIYSTFNDISVTLLFRQPFLTKFFSSCTSRTWIHKIEIDAISFIYDGSASRIRSAPAAISQSFKSSTW